MKKTCDNCEWWLDGLCPAKRVCYRWRMCKSTAMRNNLAEMQTMLRIKWSIIKINDVLVQSMGKYGAKI